MYGARDGASERHRGFSHINIANSPRRSAPPRAHTHLLATHATRAATVARARRHFTLPRTRLETLCGGVLLDSPKSQLSALSRPLFPGPRRRGLRFAISRCRPCASRPRLSRAGVGGRQQGQPKGALALRPERRGVARRDGGGAPLPNVLPTRSGSNMGRSSLSSSEFSEKPAWGAGRGCGVRSRRDNPSQL
jgi:hypothetical protein